MLNVEVKQRTQHRCL